MAASGRNTCTEIEMEPLASCCEPNESPHRHNTRSHTRSLSWTNMEPVTQPRYTPSLSSIYSISPLTTVFREFLARSGDNRTTNRPHNSHLNRTFSDSRAPQEPLSQTRSGTPPSQIRRVDSLSSGVSSAGSDGLDNREHEEVFRDNLEQPTVVEISEGVRWLERNAVFLVIILIKFALFHRAGKLYMYTRALQLMSSFVVGSSTICL